MRLHKLHLIDCFFELRETCGHLIQLDIMNLNVSVTHFQYALLYYLLCVNYTALIEEPWTYNSSALPAVHVTVMPLNCVPMVL